MGTEVPVGVSLAERAAQLRVLAWLLYRAPGQDALAALAECVESWPDPLTPAQRQVWQEGLAQPDALLLANEQLFWVPGSQRLSPFGSVYTDKDNLTWGESAQAWQRFTMAQQWQPMLECAAPDHVTEQLLLLATLLEQGNVEACSALLCDHLMPWVPRFIAGLEAQSVSRFYQAVAQMLGAVLQALMAQWSLSATAMPLYR
ncbi:molecular chaperone TorD family protein [Ferrimonas balearica]|uniref:TorD/DmsD family molecular chaperone n=1 Tax=Ferrimonas balearica TaxID=44012 RepID=UPI001C9825FF|nr:molecular chaperone TorD family protein [Ferrimonas balearica]